MGLQNYEYFKASCLKYVEKMLCETASCVLCFCCQFKIKLFRCRSYLVLFLRSCKRSRSVWVLDGNCVSVSAASLLKGLKHANIVLLHDIIHTKETLTLVFEYVVSLLTGTAKNSACRGNIWVFDFYPTSKDKWAGDDLIDKNLGKICLKNLEAPCIITAARLHKPRKHLFKFNKL